MKELEKQIVRVAIHGLDKGAMVKLMLVDVMQTLADSPKIGSQLMDALKDEYNNIIIEIKVVSLPN